MYLTTLKKEDMHTYQNKIKILKKVIFLMITDGEKWLHLAVKKLSAFFRGITSNNNKEFYFINCLHSDRLENKLKRFVMYVKIVIIVM